MFKVLSVKEYNYKMRNKWAVDVNKAHINNDYLPNLITYLYQKTTGFVAFNETESKWFKTRTEANEYVINFRKDNL